MITNRYYDVYIFKYRKSMPYSEIERSFDELSSVIKIPGTRIKYFVRDISSLDEEGQRNILNALVGAERLKVYNPNQSPLMYIHLFKLNDIEYLTVLSIYKTEELDDKLMFKFLFGMYTIEQLSMYGNKKESRYSSIAHWKEIIPENPEGILRDFNVGFSETQTEVFYLDKDYISASLENSDIAKKRSVKAMLTIIWGRILCSVFHMDDILMEDDHLGGLLPKVPIRYQIKRKPSDQYELIKKQLIDAEYYDMCTKEELDSTFNYDVSKYLLFSQQFILNGKYREFFRNIKEGIIYKLDAYVKSDAPLIVTYNPFGDKPYICYEYKEKVFGHLNIEDLHNTFCEVLRAALEPMQNEETSDTVSEQVMPIKTIASSTKNEAEMRRLAVKVKSLRMFEMFKDFSEEEINELAARCEVVHKNSQESVIETDSEVDSVFLVLSGRVEVCGVDSNSYLHTLMLLKSGELFGIESLLPDRKSFADYSICSTDAVLLSIDSEYFKQFDERRMSLLNEMLDIQSKRLVKFQRLWMLN